MSEPTTSDIFYIKVKDKTMFAIYDLQLSDDCDTITSMYTVEATSTYPKTLAV